MNEDIFLSVSPVNEAIAALDVEPLNDTGYLCSDNLLLLLGDHWFAAVRRLCFRLLLLLLLLLLRLLLLRWRWCLLLLLDLLLGRLRLLFWRTYCWLVSHVVIILPRFPHSRQYTFFRIGKTQMLVIHLIMTI